MDCIENPFQQGRSIPVLQLGRDLITPRDHVRLIGATIKSDISIDLHFSNISSSDFYWPALARPAITGHGLG